MGAALSLIRAGLVDEGDVVHLGSTNHADLIRELDLMYETHYYLHGPRDEGEDETDRLVADILAGRRGTGKLSGEQQ